MTRENFPVTTTKAPHKGKKMRPPIGPPPPFPPRKPKRPPKVTTQKPSY